MSVGDAPDDYVVRAASTPVFGRVVLSARDQHLVVDGPVHNGCPGEALTPAEAFLGGIAACGAELVQVLAREHDLALAGAEAEVGGVIDRAHAIRSDVTVFSAVRLHFTLRGVGDEEAATLVEAFKGR